jgi:hypothetical protein
MNDAIELALFLKKNSIRPEQVQDFYPTPGTISTTMYYTGLDPYTMEKVYVPKTSKEKAMQRALLQYFRPQNKEIVLEALKTAGRYDLIGTSPNCLVEDNQKRTNGKGGEKSWQGGRNQKKPSSGRPQQPTSRKNTSKGKTQSVSRKSRKPRI